MVRRKPEADSFAMIFQRGVMVHAKAGVTLHGFLVGDVGLDEGYVQERIATVLLDGRPVDNLEDARLTAGCTVALSGAMPGLAGAILRRGTPLVPMRSQGLQGPPVAPDPRTTIAVRVRLFNFLIKELGPILLSRGIVVEAGRLRSLMEEARLIGDTHYVLNGQSVTRDDLSANVEGDTEASIVLSILPPVESDAGPREGN